tara:strand:+ start:3668 stop:4522 length:855 start_codon:yes stop_codon:yes gene_type:complete
VTSQVEPSPEASETVASSPAGAEMPFTIDAFHYGKYHLVQPKSGHRAGMDAMLLAATIPDDARGRVADLGAGAGAAGLAVAARVRGVSVSLVERSEIMLDFAHRTLALEQNAWAKDRVDIIAADVSLKGAARRAAGLADDAYDWVILNPPFNDPGDRLTPDPLRAEAHAMNDGEMFDHWLRTAGAIMRPGGQVCIIARPRSIRPILDALAGRFGGTEVTPVHSRADGEAIRILVTAIKQSRGCVNFQPALIIHDGPGHSFGEHMDALNNGRSALPRRRPARQLR